LGWCCLFCLNCTVKACFSLVLFTFHLLTSYH
jgi:hypothetical protein